MTKEIQLTQGRVALVDDEDYESISEYKWHALATRNPNRFYAVSRFNGGHTYMHKLIMPCGSGLEVDHKDGNGLNNCRDNLRVATRKQNGVNCYTKNPTGYKGVKKNDYGWSVRIKNNRKEIYVGQYHSPEEAARAYDAKARELFGEFAYLNFPIEK